MQKTKKIVTLFILSALVLFLIVPNTASAAPEMTLRFAGQVPLEHTATKLMHQVANEVKEKTNGRIEITVYPANQLGDYTLVYEELIRGTIEMAAISVPSQFDPRLEVTYINCFVRNFDEAKTVFAPDGWLFKKMDELSARLGVKLLGFQVEGFIGIGSTKPVNEPLNPNADKSILVRIPNMDVYKLGAEAMGYRTVTVPWAEVYTALQTGVADGVDGMTPTAAYTMLKDVLKYWYDLNYSVENFNYMISMKTWEKLSEGDRKIIADACARVTDMSIELAKEDQEKHLELMRQAGIEVHTYTAEELKPIFEKVSATWDQLADKFTKELIDEFKKEYTPK